jgi:tetratricopeptide (TPR) repeat protein
MWLRFIARLALVASLGLPLVSCQWVSEQSADLTSRRTDRAFASGLILYERHDYWRAAERFVYALSKDPNHPLALYYLASCYEHQSEMSRGDEQIRLLDMAIDHYVSAVDLQTDPMTRDIWLASLLAAYGPAKANDPASAAMVLRAMIRADPTNSHNYFSLARLYEDSGLYDDAVTVLSEVGELRDDDANRYSQLAGVYDRLGEFDLSIDALRQHAAFEPDNPEGFYTIATFYWKKATTDVQLREQEKQSYFRLALAEVDHAIELNAEYFEALIYKGVLLQALSDLTEDLDRRNSLLVEARSAIDRANALRPAPPGGG